MKKPKITTYAVPLGLGITALHLADAHGTDPEAVLEACRDCRPDAVFLCGDCFEDLPDDEDFTKRENRNGLALLAGCAAIAPTFFAPGNHENGGSGASFFLPRPREDARLSEKVTQKLKSTGVTVLDDAWVRTVLGGKPVTVAGLSSGIVRHNRLPDTSWLAEMKEKNESVPTVLLCHHPEYVKKIPGVAESADLILAGHAHGGQIVIGGQPLFAPGQGIFPKFVHGVHRNTRGYTVISRGLCNTHLLLPRLGNPCEIVRLFL